MRLVVFGLSLSSSWGNGHATTYRGLIEALARQGWEVLFLEREASWYAAHRDLTDPDYCRLRFYRSVSELAAYAAEIAEADAVLVGSFIPDGLKVIEFASAHSRGVLAFYDIDTPATLAQMDIGSCAYLAPRAIPTFDLYFSFTGGPTLRRLEAKYAARSAHALYCAANPRIYRPLSLPKTWDLSFLGTYSPDRQPALERLLIEPARRRPDQRFIVAGPQFPADIAWPANVERVEHVSPQGHPEFYAQSRFVLNVTRADMAAAGFSPSVRLFEAAACAAAVISDVWPGIEECFSPGEEVLLARDAAEVVAYLDGAANAAEIGARARARALQQHTADHRAATFAAIVASVLESKRARSAARIAS